MNLIFGVILIVTMTMMLFVAPENVLSAFISGGEKALALSVQMTVIYAVWLGVLNIFEKTGLSVKFARALKPANKWLFGALPEKANDYVSLNISANIFSSGKLVCTGIKTKDSIRKIIHKFGKIVRRVGHKIKIKNVKIKKCITLILQLIYIKYLII